MTFTVLVGCTVVDGRIVEGVPALPDAAVWVRGERIAAVGPREEVLAHAREAGEHATVDLDGAYLTPGLVNMHTHLSLSLPGSGGDSVKTMNPHELALYMADGARRTLLSGVTTVRCVAEKEHADFALRRAITAGRVPGPRIFTAGRALVCTGGHGHESPDTLECDGADGFRRGVRSQVRAGADLIKVMISGGIAGALAPGGAGPRHRPTRTVRRPDRDGRRSGRAHLRVSRGALGDGRRAGGPGRPGRMEHLVSADADRIAAAIADMYDAFLAGDRRRFDSHLHPEVTTWETHLPGPLRSRAELDTYREGRDAAGQRPNLDRLDATDLRVDVWNDTAAARYVLVATPAGAAHREESRVTDVLRRDGGRWLIVHHHAERLAVEEGERRD